MKKKIVVDREQTLHIKCPIMQNKNMPQRVAICNSTNLEHNPESASPILLLCHGVFTDRFILRRILEHFFPRKWNLRSVYEQIRSTKTKLYFRANSGSPLITQITTTDNRGRQWNSGQFSFEIWAWWIDAIVNDVEDHTGKRTHKKYTKLD